MSEHINVWIIHKTKKVQVTNEPGVPMDVLGYVSQEAADNAKQRGYATVSELGFKSDDHKSFDDWQKAQAYGHQIADKLGYEYDVFDVHYAPYDEYDDSWDDGWDDYGWD